MPCWEAIEGTAYVGEEGVEQTEEMEEVEKEEKEEKEAKEATVGVGYDMDAFLPNNRLAH